jgi:hypothetical protein
MGIEKRKSDKMEILFIFKFSIFPSLFVSARSLSPGESQFRCECRDNISPAVYIYGKWHTSANINRGDDKQQGRMAEKGRRKGESPEQ